MSLYLNEGFYTSSWTLPGGVSAKDENDQRMLQKFLVENQDIRAAVIESIKSASANGEQPALNSAPTELPSLVNVTAPPPYSPLHDDANLRSQPLRSIRSTDPSHDHPMLECIELRDLVAEFLGSRKSAATNADSTIKEKMRSLNGFIKFVEEKRTDRTTPAFAHNLTRKLAIEFIEFVSSGGLNPPKSVMRQDCRPTPTPQKEAKVLRTGNSRKEISWKPPQPRTVVKVIGHIGELFKYAKGKNYIASNFVDESFKTVFTGLYEGVAIARMHNNFHPFKRAQLRQIFDPESMLRFNSHADYFWMPLLALFTCARLAELATLTVDDICLDDTANIYYFNLTDFDDETGQPKRRMKNVNAKRKVPVSSRLIEIGFLEYVQYIRSLGATKLFPHRQETPTNERDPGKNTSRRFGEYLDNLGLKSRKLVFHSFRHTGITALLGAGVPLGDSELIAGHAAQDLALAVARASAPKKGWVSTQVSTYLHPEFFEDDESQMLRRLSEYIDRALNFDLDFKGLGYAAGLVGDKTVKVTQGGKSIFKSGCHGNAKADHDLT